MDALPGPIRAGLLALRQAFLQRDISHESPLCSALWELAHPRPGAEMDVAEELTTAALWVGMELPLATAQEQRSAVGFVYTAPPEPEEEDLGG